MLRWLTAIVAEPGGVQQMHVALFLLRCAMRPLFPP